ncbi:MAG: hypothetical protein HFG79_00545 [Lachnospiraceae bacterium]|jgi:hypothetical protein|nr:hypothetical protein [Lachnospiraceae bacterium]
MESLQNIKTIKLFMIVMSILLLLGWMGLVWNENAIREMDLDNIIFAEDSDGYLVCVDSLKRSEDGVTLTENYIELSGWMIRSGESVRDVSIKIIFRNMDTNEYLIIPTTVVERRDVTQYFNDGCNYDNCGYSVKIRKSRKINVELYDYEVYALYTLNGNTKLVPFRTTLKTWGENNG